MNTPYERLSLALHNASRSWRFALDRRLKDLGMSQAAWMTIAVIAKAKQPMSQTELAHTTGVENPTMVSMLDRLVKGGLVERQPSPNDRRVKLVCLTAEGEAIYRQVRKVADQFREELLQQFDTALLEQVTSVLERIQTVADQAK